MSDDVLAKLHPELPVAFRQKFVRGVGLYVRAVKENGSTAESHALTREWVEWWNSHKQEVLRRFPNDVTEW